VYYRGGVFVDLVAAFDWSGRKASSPPLKLIGRGYEARALLHVAFFSGWARGSQSCLVSFACSVSRISATLTNHEASCHAHALKWLGHGLQVRAAPSKLNEEDDEGKSRTAIIFGPGNLPTKALQRQPTKMRLIDVETLRLESFTSETDVPYAILSHCWGEEEVLFQDMADGTAPRKKGYFKIERFCGITKAEGLRYAWIDTCCIDKSSSAELSEAIARCFAGTGRPTSALRRCMTAEAMRPTGPFVRTTYTQASGSRAAGRCRSLSPPRTL
jgi:hypothetical protein